MNKLARGLLLLISAFGCYAGGSLVLAHLKHGEVCPMLGPTPACILVFFDYLAIFMAALLVGKPWVKKLFYAGWAPVFTLAAFGSILELTQGQTCPVGPAGIPQCFISLVMILVCWVCFWFARKA